MLQIHFLNITRWQTKFNKNAMPEMQKKNQFKKLKINKNNRNQTLMLEIVNVAVPFSSFLC